MLPNVTLGDPQHQRDYVPKLVELASTMSGVAFVDVTTAHDKLLAKKAYVDMTGNGVNHPNDFLGRWYAQLIAALLGAI
jgi:hypothetical protein